LNIIGALSRKPFSIVGHRGAKGLAPENTLKAIGTALKLGVDAVEVDVRTTSDGKLILLHDEDFWRVAGVKAKPKEMTYDEIRYKIRINGEHVPTLKEAIELINGRAGLLVEIKEPETVDRIVDVLREYGFPKWIALISFYEEALAKVLKEKVALGLIYSKPPGKIVEAKRIGAKIVLPHFRLATKKAVNFAHKLGLKVVAWTVNDISTLAKTLENGVDAVATDYPNLALDFRASKVSLGKPDRFV